MYRCAPNGVPSSITKEPTDANFDAAAKSSIKPDKISMASPRATWVEPTQNQRNESKNFSRILLHSAAETQAIPFPRVSKFEVIYCISKLVLCFSRFARQSQSSNWNTCLMKSSWHHFPGVLLTCCTWCVEDRIVVTERHSATLHGAWLGTEPMFFRLLHVISVFKDSLLYLKRNVNRACHCSHFSWKVSQKDITVIIQSLSYLTKTSHIWVAALAAHENYKVIQKPFTSYFRRTSPITQPFQIREELYFKWAIAMISWWFGCNGVVKFWRTVLHTTYQFFSSQHQVKHSSWIFTQSYKPTA